MLLEPGEEIGEEMHNLDQFIRFEVREAKVILDGVEYMVKAEDTVIIPQGTRHNVINIGLEALKLYSIYSPPEHKDGTVHPTKAGAVEEHFDGTATE